MLARQFFRFSFVVLGMANFAATPLIADHSGCTAYAEPAIKLVVHRPVWAREYAEKVCSSWGLEAFKKVVSSRFYGWQLKHAIRCC
jgi:hypothetical protein